MHNVSFHPANTGQGAHLPSMNGPDSFSIVCMWLAAPPPQ